MHYWEEFFARIRDGDVARVRILLDENPELTNAQENKSVSSLHIAASRGHLELASLLIERGAQLEAESSATGSTPLKYAVFYAQIEMVKMLLQRGAEIDNPGGTARSPLQLALDASSQTFREMGTPGTDLDYARIANILRSKSLRSPEMKDEIH